ncbi:MAG: hypothetical protein UMR38_08365 [Candidatus Izemoplasma sp.]|nr:hypothetical protein [Candidatus Izemoplasma sp.]
MNKKIILKFQGIPFMTTLGWAILLLLGLLSRGTVPDGVFWLVITTISLLLIIDTIYFIARVSQGHYVIISHRKLIFKRFFQPVEVLLMDDLEQISVAKDKFGNKVIVVTDGTKTIVLKHDYQFTKEAMFLYIQQAHFFSKSCKIINDTQTE